MKWINALYRRHKRLVDYIFFGGLTTLVNVVPFFVLEKGLGWSYLVANAISIILSILFAYVTNKIWVFNSRTTNVLALAREFLSFLLFRALSGLMDMALMWLLVDGLATPTGLAKLATQVMVVVLNYIFSKFFVFRSNGDG